MMRTRFNDGFTLVEMMAVLAILSITVLISIPFVHGPGDGLALDAEARIIASRLREARDTAMLRREATTVVVQFKPAGISGPGLRPLHQVSAPFTLHVETARGLLSDEKAAFRFTSDGGSTGGDIVLAARGSSRTVRVNWLTGAVTIMAENSQ